jgi:hypothetical protein
MHNIFKGCKIKKETKDRIKKGAAILAMAPFFIAGAVGCGDDNGEKPPVNPTCVCPPDGPEGEHFESCEYYGCEVGGCEITEKVKEQSATIDLFEDNTATVKGHLTNAQWADVAGKIEAAINDAFNSGTGPVANVKRNRFRNVFSGTIGVTIIVEQTSEYGTYKTTEDAVTLYLNIAALNNVDLQEKITAAVTAMNNGEPTMARVRPMNVIEYAKSLGTTKGKFAKYNNIRNNVQFKVAQYRGMLVRS